MELEALAEGGFESLDSPLEESALDQQKSKPTQTAPVQDIMVEDQCRSAWVSQVLEKQRCHFVHYLGHSSGSASPSEGAGSASPKDDEMESILDALSPLPDDFSPLNSEELDALAREYETDLGAVDKPPVPKHVLATVAEVEGGNNEPSKTPPRAEAADREAPGAPARTNTRQMPPPVARTLEFPPESSAAYELRAQQIGRAHV